MKSFLIDLAKKLGGALGVGGLVAGGTGNIYLDIAMAAASVVSLAVANPSILPKGAAKYVPATEKGLKILVNALNQKSGRSR